jgi:hypothetical protein
LGHPDWFFYLSTGNGYVISDHQYLAHTELEMDQDVWLTQEGIVNNKDDVVEAAIEWINISTSVDENNNEMILDYHLENNYPNPFNPTTKIKYQIPKVSFVTLKIYDVLGNEVITLVETEKSAGEYEVVFNAQNLPSGIYFYSLIVGNFTKTRNMIFLK